MRNSLRFELYKLIKSKYLILIFISSFIYSVLINMLYINEDAIYLYQNFTDEYFILYLCIAILYSSNIFWEEYEFNTYDDIKNKYIFVSKIIMVLIVLFITFLSSIIFCYDISLFCFDAPYIPFKILGEIITSFIKVMPMIAMISLITMILSILFLRSNLATLLVFLLFVSCDYLKMIILNSKLKILKYSFIFAWDFSSLENRELISLKMRVILSCAWIILFLMILKFLFFYRKKN